MPRRRLEDLLASFHVHDWQTDPFSRGAYSYVPVGAIEARKTLARSVQNTLYFAGEAAHFQGQAGTVAGAIASGLNAAKEIVHMK